MKSHKEVEMLTAMQLTPEQLSETLRLHQLWLRSDPNGSRARLNGARLNGADLAGVNLTGAILSRADLSRADLSRARLNGAILAGVNLTGVNLTGADLSRARLNGAILTDATLTGADLDGADLSRARLNGAILTDATLTDATLTDATLTGATLPGFQLPAGELRVWKKARARNGRDVIVELIIPADARRTASLVGPKCRTERAAVVAVHGADEAESGGQPGGFARLRYVPGESVVPHDYSDDPRVECAPGVHFFRTRKEAEEYQL